MEWIKITGMTQPPELTPLLVHDGKRHVYAFVLKNTVYSYITGGKQPLSHFTHYCKIEDPT